MLHTPYIKHLKWHIISCKDRKKTLACYILKAYSVLKIIIKQFDARHAIPKKQVAPEIRRNNQTNTINHFSCGTAITL